jgi:LysR family transcriptional regulator, benzoate and cis,cis-muconate-responsive activator of ben and cat genes
MDLRSLRYYVATVEEGSISAAALRCHVAQPSITLAIAKLEDELDCRLLHRHTKGCETTPDGRRMYQMALELLGHADSIRSAFRHNDRIHQRIALDKTVRIGVLEELVSRAEKAGHELELEIVSDAASADLRLTIESSLSASEHFFPLFEEHYALLIPDNNVLAFQKTMQISDLNQQRLIERIHCEGQQEFQRGCEHYGIRFNMIASVETEEWAHGLVASKLGMTFAPVPLNFSDPRFICRNIQESLGLEVPTRHVGIALKAKADPRLEALWKNWNA